VAKEVYVNPKGQITDYLGLPLNPGDIVIHGYRGESYEPFHCGVFLKENESTLSIAKFGRKYNRKTKETETVMTISAIGKSYDLTQPVVIISNPLFSMQNTKVIEALEIIDILKSRRLLPQDFQAGDNTEAYLNGEN
jgi:hypothetical protein